MYGAHMYVRRIETERCTRRGSPFPQTSNLSPTALSHHTLGTGSSRLESDEMRWDPMIACETTAPITEAVNKWLSCYSKVQHTQRVALPDLDSLLGDQRVRPHDHDERYPQAQARLGGPLQPSTFPCAGPKRNKKTDKTIRHGRGNTTAHDEWNNHKHILRKVCPTKEQVMSLDANCCQNSNSNTHPPDRSTVNQVKTYRGDDVLGQGVLDVPEVKVSSQTVYLAQGLLEAVQ